jgi:hypothetical protein
MAFTLTRITAWKRYFLDQLPHIFTRGNTNKEKACEEDKEALLRKIGQLEMEREWLQKKLNSFQLKRGKGL